MAAGLLLIFLFPLLSVCMVFVALDGGPIFYRQLRVGQRQKLFSIVKLRTMLVDADRYLDATGKPTAIRTTPIGAILRKSSLDELPQLWNVLKGEMTFVGPRPILPGMLPYLTAGERERFNVKPGLTGLAQIKGRNNLIWSRRFRYDIFYVKHSNSLLDLWIVWRTVVVLLRGEGVVLDRNPTKVDDVTNRVVQSPTAR